MIVLLAIIITFIFVTIGNWIEIRESRNEEGKDIVIEKENKNILL